MAAPATPSTEPGNDGDDVADAARSVVLLRGVNVGGVTIRMADLADCVRSAGFDDVRTVLASGNVLIDSARSPSTDKAAIESALRARFGYEAWVHVLRLDELRAIVDAYPFEADREGRHDYVIVCAKPELAAEIVELAGGDAVEDDAAADDAAADDAPGPADLTEAGRGQGAARDAAESVSPGDGVVYWTVPKGDTLSSPVGRLTSKTRFRQWTTTRNLRTLRKLLS